MKRFSLYMILMLRIAQWLRIKLNAQHLLLFQGFIMYTFLMIGQ